MITISIDDRSVLEALSALRDKTHHLAPALRDIGEQLQETTKRRFDTSTAPNGSKWAPNTQTTILQYLGAYSGSYTKSGKISAKGIGRQANKKPLIGETGNGSLMNTINYFVNGNESVEVGSAKEYAAVQQFGARQGEFGRDRRNHPIPWGDIPARPFLGIDDEDRRSILGILAGYLNPTG